MQLHRQAEPLGHLEHARGLAAAEGDAFHERIDRIGQLLFGDGRQHLPAQARDVAVLVAVGFGRERVRAEEGGGDGDRSFAGEATGGAELAGFGFHLQTITRLDLDGCDTFRDQRIEPRQRLRDQFILGCGAGGLHGGENAAAGARDFLVAGARKPQLELVRAVAAVDEMRVAVDQPRRDPPAFEIDAFFRVQGRLLGARPDPGDPAIRCRDCAVLDDAEARACGVERRDAGMRPKPIHLHRRPSGVINAWGQATLAPLLCYVYT